MTEEVDVGTDGGLLAHISFYLEYQLNWLFAQRIRRRWRRFYGDREVINGDDRRLRSMCFCLLPFFEIFVKNKTISLYFLLIIGTYILGVSLMDNNNSGFFKNLIGLLIILIVDWWEKTSCCWCTVPLFKVCYGLYRESSSTLWLEIAFVEGNNVPVWHCLLLNYDFGLWL